MIEKNPESGIKVNTLLIFMLFTTMVLTVASCSGDGKNTQDQTVKNNDKSPALEPVTIDLPEIRQDGKLTALTSYSSTSYFIYRGQVMGYEYELLNRLADHLELELEIKVVDDMDQIINMLLQGEGDIISHGLTVTRERRKQVQFTEYHTTTHQVLVQRKPENWRKMKLHEIDEILVRDPLELIGKKVHVRKNSSYYKRLQNLMDEIGGEIEIVPVSGDLETEEIIRMVADGEIDYTVADQNIAYINAAYYPILDVKTAISFNQRIAWAVRPNSPKLLKAVNDWIAKMKQSTDYYVIYNKYFKNRRAYRSRAKSDFLSTRSGRISRYDDVIKQYADSVGWDWRLLAAQVYKESQFDPKAQSWAGARGLLQLMPATARELGYKPANMKNAETSIRAGTDYLAYLQEYWDQIPDSVERIKFILASYNVGKNHIQDARRLAEKYEADPDIWTGNVEEFILKKSNPKYYNHTVVEFGYARGSEPYEYVREIFETYEIYRNLIPE